MGIELIIERKKHFFIDLHLNDVGDIFEPKMAPLSKTPVYESGIKQIFDELRTRHFTEPAEVKIYLPKEKMPSDSKKVLESIKNYCEHKMHINDLELINNKWEGKKAAVSGITFLAICVILSVIIGYFDFVPELFSSVLTEGLLVVGWVGMWKPAQTFLYGWWPFWKNKKIYEKISRSKIVFVEEK
jgi:hypothetical protein